MASGQQIAAANIKKFKDWIKERKAAEDWKDYLRGRQLNRTDIAKECGFATSVLRQNPTVKGDLEALEKELADSGIIPSPCGESSSQATSTPSERATDDRIILINTKLKSALRPLRKKMRLSLPN